MHDYSNSIQAAKKRSERRLNIFPAVFWSKIKVCNMGDCWEWTGTISANGYGTIKRRGRTVNTHRVAYELANGKIKDGLFVCHHCDNKKCCNPYHLFLGTNSDNQLDSVAKGRKPIVVGEKNPMFGKIGENSPCAKYTNEDILEIRRKYATGSFTQSALAKEYGTTQGSIGQIVRRYSWKHI